MTIVTKKDLTFEPIKGGVGAGGMHRDHNSTGVRVTHNLSGIVCVVRGRSLARNKKKAIEEIRGRLLLEKKKAGDRHRKERWRNAIRDRGVVRTYNAKRNEVKDHRTGQKANMDDVLAGNLDTMQTMVMMEAARRAKIKTDMEKSLILDQHDKSEVKVPKCLK